MKNVQTALDRLGLPVECAGAPRLMISGTGRMIIENHGRIMEFSSGLLRLCSGGENITVRGEGLRICSMDSHGLVLMGRISGLDLG